ncbi:MAG TPA: hypothetical protein VJG67_02260 [Candidatus Paceibacterota bacterium]
MNAVTETQIITGLPVENILEVIVHENNEPMVPVKETEKIQLLKKHKYLWPVLRKTVYELLVKASNNLPERYKLLLSLYKKAKRF